MARSVRCARRRPSYPPDRWNDARVPERTSIGGPDSILVDAERVAAVRATGLLDAAAQGWADELTALAAHLLKAPLVFMTLLDDRRSFWLSTYGVVATAPHARENAAQESFCQYVVQDAAPLIVSDAAEHPRTRANPSVAAMGVRAWAGHPLIDASGHALGSFCVFDTVVRAWTDADAAALAVLARAASTQLSLLHAITSERATSQRLEGLARVALGLVAAETIEDLAEVVLHEGLPVLGTDGGAVLVREADGFRTAVSEGRTSGVPIARGWMALDDPLPGPEVGRTGVRIVLRRRAEGSAHSAIMAKAHTRTDWNAWVIEPLRLGNHVLGSLVISWQEVRTFSADDLALTAAFAAQCAQALGRILVTEAQRASTIALYQVAETLQRSLLTQPPAPNNLEIAVRYLPAHHSMQVGGDWHDAFTCADGTTMISVGDVCGHDSTAASVMAQIRNLLRGMAIDSADSPARLLDRLDRAMGTLGIEVFTTAIVAKIAGSTVQWSSAGHPPPILCARGAAAKVLDDAPDPPLAVGSSLVRTDRTATLEPGDTLIFATDGLIEHRGQIIDVGIERLRATAAQCSDLDAESMCDHILATALTEPHEDDVVLMVVRLR